MTAVNGADIAIIAAVALAVGYGVVTTVKHFRGQGGCCGGGGGPVHTEEKTLENPEIMRYVMEIEGMHCQNCKAVIERQINRIDGAACTVDLKQKTATVRCDKPVDPETLRRTVAMLDYKVISVREAAHDTV